jgi:hypothetical protein
MLWFDEFYGHPYFFNNVLKNHLSGRIFIFALIKDKLLFLCLKDLLLLIGRGGCHKLAYYYKVI